MSGRCALINEEKLKKAVRHIAYEVRLLAYTAELLGGEHASPPTLGDDDEKNVFLESFLLHYRNLLVFLCPEGRRVLDTDVVASDFPDNRKDKPKNVGRRNRLIDDSVKTRLDQMLAHITFCRAQYLEAKDISWRIAEMFEGMLGEFQHFVDQLPRTWQERFLQEPGMKDLLSNIA